MRLLSHNKVETNRYELEIEVDAKTFDEACNVSYKKNIGKMNIPGFRVGKAPRGFAEKMYGANVFYEDAINEVYPPSVTEACKEAGLTMIDDKVDFDIVNASKEEGLTYKVTITVKPEVEVKDYKGIKVDKVTCNISDADVDAELDKIRNRNSRQISVEDRPAVVGDTSVIDYEGFLDGVPFDGGKGENHSLTLGSGQFIPGFEEQIVGHSIGEDFDVNVTFPEEYHEESLKGKPVVFKVHLHELKAKELPELDDEFAKDVSEFDTLAEYKEDLKKKLLEEKEKVSSDDMENDLISTVIESMTVEVPQAMYERQIDQNMQDFDYRLQSQGMNLDTYMKYTGMDVDAFRGNFAVQAERQVKIRLALEKIVELENLAVTDEEKDAEIARMAEMYKMEVDKIKQFVPIEEIEKDLSVKKAIELVKETAVVNEVAEKTEKKEVKKVASKPKTAAKPKAATAKAKAEPKEETETKAKAAPKAKTTAVKKTENKD